jgi:17beta-estradiol 17-dehydrogenase / very-long-chain 3-oxoacyl-CoA reductase
LKASEETKHVDCLAIVPGDVRTQGNSEGVSESEPRWDEFGELIVRKVDNTITRGEMEMIPFAMHDIKNRILWGLPESVKTKALTEYLGMKRDAFNAVYQKER